MRGKLTKHWRQELRCLLEDQRKTEYFVKKLLRRIFEEDVILCGLRTSTPEKEKKLADTDAVVLKLTVLTGRQERDILLRICEETADRESATAVILHYYCVEAPAILVDSGTAEIRVTVDSELEDLIWQTAAH